MATRRCPRRHRHMTVYAVHLNTVHEHVWYWCQDCGAIRSWDDERWTYPKARLEVHIVGAPKPETRAVLVETMQEAYGELGLHDSPANDDSSDEDIPF